MSTKKTVRRVGPSNQGSLEARRKASVVLEVLSGNIAAQDAAAALGISPPKYYVVESRALDGLIAGCEPRRRGKVPSPELEAAKLKRENAQLSRQVARYQALLRASHKTVGLVAKPKDEKGKRKKRPAVRALKFAKQMKAEDESSKPTPSGQEQSS